MNLANRNMLLWMLKVLCLIPYFCSPCICESLFFKWRLATLGLLRVGVLRIDLCSIHTHTHTRRKKEKRKKDWLVFYLFLLLIILVFSLVCTNIIKNNHNYTIQIIYFFLEVQIIQDINFYIYIYIHTHTHLIPGWGPNAIRLYLKKWARPINVDTS